MRITISSIAALIVVGGCSFYNFFGYEDDTGLHVIERPSGYDSAKFGFEIAPTATVLRNSET